MPIALPKIHSCIYHKSQILKTKSQKYFVPLFILFKMTTQPPPHGEQHLPTLLSTLSAHLSTETYVWTSVSTAREREILARLDDEGVQPVMVLREPHFTPGGDTPEGTTTLILPHPLPANLEEDHGLKTEYHCRRLTLCVESSLAAVGLMAAVGGALADAGISVNTVAGYWHDHLFIAVSQASLALEVISGVAQRAREEAAAARQS